jgi:cytochrome bd-type quinol oxidase subunit 2
MLPVYKLAVTSMENLIRLLILAVLLAIVVSLGSALFHLSRGTERDSTKLARALAIRIGLSVALFVLLMIAWYLGLISPHGLAAHSQ